MLAPLSLISACSAVGLLNAAAPRGGLRIERDIAYAAGPRHTLDIYAPDDASRAPVIVFFYGGGWSDGDKADYQFVATSLARRGFVTIVPDYRLYPAVRFPAFLEDGAHAVAWARAHAARYGGDPHRLVLAGHSAGAYIAVMLATDRSYLRAVGIDPGSDLAGVVGLAGPYDFLPLVEDKYKIIFGTDPSIDDTQPVNHVAGGEPPMLLIAGTADETVLPKNTRSMAARLRAAGDRVEEKYYPGVDHVRLIGAVGWPLRFLAPTLDDVTDFVRALPATGAHPPGAHPPGATPPAAPPATR